MAESPSFIFISFSEVTGGRFVVSDGVLVVVVTGLPEMLVLILVGKLDSSTNEEIWDYGYGEGRDNPPTSIIMKKEAQREHLYQMSPLE
ncbi:Pheophorbidase, partial [Bienertia sinuspersici]